MSVIHEAADRVRQLAKELEALAPQVSLPAQQYSIAEAMSKLRAVLGPKAYFSIQPGAFWVDSDNSVSQDEWTIYGPTSAKLHRGPTLAAAVNAFLAAKTAPPSDPIEDYEDLVAAAEEKPF